MCHTGESISTPARGPTKASSDMIWISLFTSLFILKSHVSLGKTWQNWPKLKKKKTGSEWNTLCNTGGEKAYLAKEF